MPQQPNQTNQEAERLRAAANDESLSPEQRNIAAKLLEQLEKPRPATASAMLAEVFNNIDAKAAAYRADQVERFKVCSGCLLKQSKANEVCELCGAAKWESPVPASIERERFIAATTDYTDEELNRHIANDSINVSFAAHCAKVLELRGAPRVLSFWERGGFDFYGRPHAA